METKTLLFIIWIVVVLLWLFNQFYYTNQRRELEYRRKIAAEKKDAGS